MQLPDNGLRSNPAPTARAGGEEDPNVEALLIGDFNHPDPLAGATEEELRSLAPSEGTGVTGNVVVPPADVPPPPAATP